MRPSATRNGPGEWADTNSPARREVFGAIRRMAITLTSRALWQLIGHDLPDGRKEARPANVFSGIGFFARPKATDRAEAIVLFPGAGAGHPAIVAMRNEDARKIIEAALNAGAGLAEGETVAYGAAALLHFKADGTLEARTPGGVAVELALKTDVSKIETAIAGATITPNDGGATLKATIIAGLSTSLHGAAGTTPWPVGTTKLKGQ
jgi:hypothetical protein